MPPKISLSGTTSGGGHGKVAPPSDSQEKWVNVTWMPHSALSQTSHVCLIIRSAHATFDPIYDRHYSSEFYTDENPVEWKIRIGVYGISGLLLVPVYTNSTAAPLVSRRKSKHLTKEQNIGQRHSDVKEYSTISSRDCLMTTILNATHDCWWDCLVQIPIRWRDLPRDAYLHFEVLGQHNVIVSSTTLPLFSKYGKLVTGLQKLKLESKPLHADINYGLESFGSEYENFAKHDYSDDQQDPVWKACCILDQLSRLEKQSRSPTMNNNDDFGNIPCVPWLDSMLKVRAEQIIAEASIGSDVSHDTLFVLRDYKLGSLIVFLSYSIQLY
jgi:Phosphoinositide 3-kinase C2